MDISKLGDHLRNASSDVLPLIPAKMTVDLPHGAKWPSNTSGTNQPRTVISDGMVRAPIFAYVVLATVLAYKVKDKSSVPSAARVLVDELATIIENAWSYRYADTLVEAKNEHANAITDGMVAASMLAAS
ncbi:MAG: hypothetical protein ABL866_17645 [Devosia sp.]